MVNRNEGITIGPSQSQHPIAALVFHGAMVKHFREKLRFAGTGTVKQAVINNKDVFTVISRQRLHKTIYDPGGKQGCKTLPVGFGAVKETVNRIFAKTAIKGARFSLHIHASVRENKTKQVTEDVHHGNALQFTGIAPEKEFPNPELPEKICCGIKNLISVFGIVWYT